MFLNSFGQSLRREVAIGRLDSELARGINGEESLRREVAIGRLDSELARGINGEEEREQGWHYLGMASSHFFTASLLPHQTIYGGNFILVVTH